MPRIAVARNLRLVFFGVLLFASAQVFWWIYDLGRHGEQDVADATGLYEGDVQAAAELMRGGANGTEIEGLFPHLRVESGRVSVLPEALAALEDRAASRKNQYRWEGGFFLSVLVVMMMLLRRTMEAEAELRCQQEDFIAAVSHELKSPLASLQLAAETMELRTLDEEGRARHLKRIRADIHRLSSMVSNILDSTKLARGDIKLRPERVNVSRLLQLEVENIQDRANARKVALTVLVSDSAELTADPTALQVVVRNLLENAVHAAAAAGGGNVSVSFSCDHRESVLTVEDDGVGFPSGEGRRIFESFYRVGTELQRETPGSGLGLAIVERYLRLAGADIEGHSDGPGLGARFTVRWPQSSGRAS
jgi:signal transduction histidine kinase